VADWAPSCALTSGQRSSACVDVVYCVVYCVVRRGGEGFCSEGVVVRFVVRVVLIVRFVVRVVLIVRFVAGVVVSVVGGEGFSKGYSEKL